MSGPGLPSATGETGATRYAPMHPLRTDAPRAPTTIATADRLMPPIAGGIIPRSSRHPVFFLRVGRQGDPVARTLREPEGAVLAARHALEEITRRPVDELDQEGVRHGGGEVQRELVDDVRRDGDLVGGGQRADAEHLAEAVGAADVGHQIGGGATLDRLAELEARVVVL